MNDVLVLGSQGHAASVVDSIEKAGEYRIVGLLDRFRQPGTEALGFEILGGEEDLPVLVKRLRTDRFVIAVGDNWKRFQVVERLLSIEPNLQFPAIIHPAATIGRRVTIEPGTVVMAGAVINADSILRNFCLVNTQASIDHECVLGNYASVAPGATLGGRVSVGDYSAVGLGTNVIEKCHIGAHTVIGAGATVLQNIPDRMLAYGTPAKVIRKRDIGEGYLR